MGKTLSGANDADSFYDWTPGPPESKEPPNWDQGSIIANLGAKFSSRCAKCGRRTVRCRLVSGYQVELDVGYRAVQAVADDDRMPIGNLTRGFILIPHELVCR